MLQVMPHAAFDPAAEWQDLEDRSSARLRPEDREFHARSNTLFPVRGRPRRPVDPRREPAPEPLSTAERQAQHKSRQRILEAMALEAGYPSVVDLAAALLREPANRRWAGEVRALASQPALLAAIHESRVVAADIEDVASDVLRAAYRKWTLPPQGRLEPSPGPRAAFTPLGSLPRSVQLPAGPQLMLIVQAADEAGRTLGRHAEPPDFEYLVRLGAGRAGGRLVLPRPEAGGFLVAFARVDQAVAAARQIRADLAAPDPPIHYRMALHAGPLAAPLGGYPSSDVHRCDALALLADRDRVLLSSAAKGLLAPEAAARAGVRSWGVRTLPDLEQDHVYELEGGTSAPPPEQGCLMGALGRLPALPIVALPDLIMKGLEAVRSGARLVTFSGPAGAGATRVAFQLAVALAAEFPDGVCGVDLAAAVARSQVAKVVAEALQVRTPGPDAVGPLAAHLRGRRALLVLDSCDRALSECQQLLDLLLARCPDLVVLATSLEPLSLAGERGFNLRPLSLPRTAGGAVRLVDIDSSESGRLFTTRAEEVNPEHRFEEAEAVAVADLCHLVQGLPLAIELIAALAASAASPPSEMARALREYLEQQTGVPAPALPRESLLQLAIAWRFHRLSPELARIVLILSLFPADFDTAAAASVCGELAHGPGAVQEQLQELARQGFMRSIGDGARFRIPESIRFECDALRRYQESLVSEVEAARTRFADHFATLLAAAVGDVHGPERRERLERLKLDIPNFRAALLWCRDHPERAPTWARLAGAYAWFLLQIGHTEEAERAVVDGLERWTASDPTRQMLLSHAGLIAWRRGEAERAAAHWVEAAEVAHAVGDVEERARALDQVGMAALARGDHATAAACCREGLELARSVSSAGRIGFCLFHLGLLALRSNDIVAARERLEESLRWRLEEVPATPDRVAYTRLGLAELAIAEGDLAAARTHLGQALTMYGERQHRLGVASTLCLCGVLAAAEPDPDCAVRLSAAADRILDDLGQRLPAIWQPTIGRAMAGARLRLGPRHTQLAERFGAGLDDDDAIAYAREHLALAVGPAQA